MNDHRLNEARDGYEIESRGAVWCQIGIGFLIYSGIIVAVAYTALAIFK